jgi:hypothetical protein
LTEEICGRHSRRAAAPAQKPAPLLRLLRISSARPGSQSCPRVGQSRSPASGRRIAVGIGATGPIVADEDDDDLLAGRRDPPRSRPMTTHPDQGRVPATLLLALELSRPEETARPARGLPYGGDARRRSDQLTDLRRVSASGRGCDQPGPRQERPFGTW